MKNLRRFQILLLLLFVLNLSAQIEVEKCEMINDSGEVVKCVMLTEKGFKQLVDLVSQSTEEASPKKEREFLLENAFSADWIEKRYNVGNANKNSFSLIQVADFFGVDWTRSDSNRRESKKVIAGRIFAKIQEIRGD